MKIICHPFSKRSGRIIVLVALIIFIFTGSAEAQTIFFDKYDVENGLGSSKVYSIIQDKNDFIWLGTESGATRFDGNKFENYSSIHGLAAGGVKSICQDTLGRLWFGHLNGGVSYFDGVKFIRTEFDSLKVNSDITAICQIGKELWFTTSSNGAFRVPFPPTGDTLLKGKHYTGKEGLSDQIFNMYIDRNRNLFCITDAFIKKYNPEKDFFETYSPQGLTTYFNVVAMFQDSKGNYWYGLHNGGLYIQDATTGKMKIYDILNGLSRMFITCFAEDYRGNVWVGTWGGGITVFRDGETIIYNKKNGLDALNVHALFEDKEKNILIADHYEGLSIYKGDHFITYNTQEFLPDNNIWAISCDKSGRYWFGTNNGISMFNPSKTGTEQITFFNEATKMIGNPIRFIVAGEGLDMWIGTQGYGIYRFDLNTGKFNLDLEVNKMLPIDRVVTALTTDNKHNIWIGTNDGLAVWDPSKKAGTVFTQVKGLAGNIIKSVFCDSKGTIWVGSEMKSGLSRLLPNSDKFSIVNIGEGIVPQVIGETSDGTIWVGTVNGLIALKNDTVAYILSEKEGLLSGNIKFIQPYDDKFLYIGTNLGLNRINLETGIISSYTKYSGFTGIEALHNASFKDAQSRLWFGTTNGVIMHDPSKLPPDPEPPKTFITGIEVNYQPREMKADLKLNYREKSINFYY
ncbi:MAG TPA: two-component regulator propeller domain-containing protein, partial [Bacteroidales bacterium]|nr:two-component regulator propeller domain-containing protein [Bacteroidales bacterium]